MSGAAFEGLEGLSSAELGESYEPGSTGFEQSMLDALLADIIGIVDDCRWHYVVYYYNEKEELYLGKDGFRRAVQRTTALLSRGDWSGGQELLDAAVLRLPCLLDEYGIERSNYVLDPLIQALYLVGENGLTLDLSPLGRVHQYHAATHLSGVPGNPLHLVFRGLGVDLFGTESSHAVFDVHSPVYERGGCKATFSFFDFHGQVGMPGCWGSDCTLHMDEIYGYPTDAEGCSYYVRNGFGELRARAYAEEGFFTSRNRLFVPKGSDWEEVRA